MPTEDGNLTLVKDNVNESCPEGIFFFRFQEFLVVGDLSGPIFGLLDGAAFATILVHALHRLGLPIGRISVRHFVHEGFDSPLIPVFQS